MGAFFDRLGVSSDDIEQLMQASLGLSFNVGTNTFLNFRLDVSSIDLSVFGGPFVAPGAIPTFEFTLYDNPSGVTNLGFGTILDVHQASGTASPRDVFDWTEVILALDASGSTNGNVTLRIDLLSGGYAAMDNFLIVSSDTPGDFGQVPEPTTLVMFGFGVAGAAVARMVRRKPWVRG